MPKHHLFNRDEQLPSYFMNVIQEHLSGLASNLRLERVDADTIRVPVPAAEGIVAVPVQGRWRYRTTAVTRDLPGGDGEKDVWVTASENQIDSSPDPFTDNTDYNFDLRITASGVDPTGVDLFMKVGELTVISGAITELRQTYGQVPGGLLKADALQDGGGVAISRAPGGALLLAAAGRFFDFELLTMEGGTKTLTTSYQELATTQKGVYTPPSSGLLMVQWSAYLLATNTSGGPFTNLRQTIYATPSVKVGAGSPAAQPGPEVFRADGRFPSDTGPAPAFGRTVGGSRPLLLEVTAGVELQFGVMAKAAVSGSGDAFAGFDAAGEKSGGLGLFLFDDPLT